jgi:hypothetical protein
MMSKRDKMLDHPVGAIHESPERISVVKSGGQFVNCPLYLFLRVGHEAAHPCLPHFSASSRETLFGSGLPGLG